MDRCPTCRARFAGDPVCYRCGTDLHSILDVERSAARLRVQARLALEEGALAEAEALARQACLQHRSRESLMTRACVALATGEYGKAVALWRESPRDAGRAAGGA